MTRENELDGLKCKTCLLRDACIHLLEGVPPEEDEECLLYKEERHGKWIKFQCGYETHSKCSVCGEKCQTYCYPYNMDKPRDRYCLWCGASMLANDRQVTGKLKQPCPCDTCQTRIDRCGCQMHLCSDYQKWLSVRGVVQI